MSMCTGENQDNDEQGSIDTLDGNSSSHRNLVLKFFFNFDAGLDENSGITFAGGMLWSINDGGNEPILYGIDTITGNTVKMLEIEDATNKDWEDITSDDSYIYIGDVGNNSGSRTDLCIYKISLQDLNTAESEVTADIIEFSYEDQMNYLPSYNSSSFDCEALFSAGESLYLYTKDWSELTTSLYQLPKVPGTYEAKKLSTLDVRCLITGADYDEDDRFLALIGYKDYTPVIFLSYGGFNLASNDSTVRHMFMESLGAQTEGIMIRNDTVWVTCEKSIVPASMYYLTEEEEDSTQ